MGRPKTYTIMIGALILLTCGNNEDQIDLSVLRKEVLSFQSGMDIGRPILSNGPHNERSASIQDLINMLSNADLQNVRNRKLSAVISMHDVNNDWSHLQIEGIRSILHLFDITIMAITDGEFNPSKQIADYENVFKTLTPDLLITIPLDLKHSGAVLRRATKRGTKIVLIDAVPDGFEHPQDYVGLVSADSYANGVVSAELLIDALGGSGNVAMLNWHLNLFTTSQRSEAARKTFLENPHIRLISESFFTGVFEVRSITKKIIRENPELNGLWVVWDTPALESVTEIQKSNSNIKVSTIDLGLQAVREIERGEILAGVGAQHPFDQGQAEALMGIIALSGKTPPPYVAISAEKVTKSNLEPAFNNVFRPDTALKLRFLIQDYE